MVQNSLHYNTVIYSEIIIYILLTLFEFSKVDEISNNVAIIKKVNDVFMAYLLVINFCIILSTQTYNIM